MVSRPQGLAALFAALLLATPLSAQQIRILSDREVGPDRIPLGFPVPVPQDTPLPFDGFRSYLGLHVRAQDLTLASPRLQAHVVGRTREDREIWAYVVSDADGTGHEGRPEPALLINGGIHAREWQSPEVVMGLLESLVESSDADGLDRFLLEEVNLVIVPVLNVDGFLMTQREPARVWEGADPISPVWPRDGRMRRKNHLGSDGVFDTPADHRAGVDLNRNNAPYWATSTQSSSNPDSLLHHGAAAASEPEIRALQAAGRLAPEAQLRAYVDAHSFGQVLFTIRTGNGRRDQIMNALAQDFSRHHRAISVTPERPNGRSYGISPDQPGAGLGQTAEYYANQWQIPAWTLEIEPGNTGAVEYGGFGYSHDGFILPESQIRRVREQLAESHRVLLYHAAGPASIRALRLQTMDGEELQWQHWQATPDGARQLQLERQIALTPGTRYRLLLEFDRPMRSGAAAEARVLPGQDEALLHPRLSLLDAERRLELPFAQGRWLGQPDAGGHSYARWRFDRYLLEFDLPADYPPGNSRLEVDAVDLIGRRLDARPQTPVGWADGHWQGYDRSSAGPSEGDFGGVDDGLQVLVAAADAPRIALLQRPLELSEGGSVRLRFERRGDASAATSLTLQWAADAAVIASSSRLDWAAGESGLRELVLSLPDDLEPSPPRQLRLQLSGALAPFAEIALTLRDNDAPDLRQAVIGEALGESTPAARAARLGELLRLASAQPVPVEILLSGDVAFAAAAAGSPLLEDLPALGGDLHLRGAQVTLALGGRVLPPIAAGARLRISGLRLREAAAGTAAVFNVAGELQLQDCRLEGSSGTLLEVSGRLQVQRCALLQLPAAAIRIDTGEAVISNSTLAGAAAAAAPLWLQQGGQSHWQHVSLLADGTAPAVQVTAGGLLQVSDSLLSLGEGAADPCAAFDGLLAGGNVLGARSCAPAVGDDQRLAVAVIDAIDADGSAVPAAIVSAAARSCPQRDQRGMPRAAECLPGARSADAAFARGLWWDPRRPGHGQHITVVQNVVFLLWYTYDEAGQPITWTAQGELQAGRLFAPLLQWRRQALTDRPLSVQIGGVDLRVVAADRIHLGWGLNDGSASGFEVLQPFRFGAAPDQPAALRSGLYADPADPGWGLSLQEEAGTSFALLYYYAADERLRWVSAQGDAGTDLRLAALAQYGPCPACGAGAQSPARASGELRISAASADAVDFSGVMSAALPPGGSWTRRSRLQRFDPLPE